jgi:hypothetical protein
MGNHFLYICILFFFRKYKKNRALKTRNPACLDPSPLVIPRAEEYAKTQNFQLFVAIECRRYRIGIGGQLAPLQGKSHLAASQQKTGDDLSMKYAARDKGSTPYAVQPLVLPMMLYHTITALPFSKDAL